MKKVVSFLLTLIMVFGLMGCAGSDKEKKKEDTNVSGNENADLKAAVILGIGGLGDQSYNDLVYSGLERAKEELGVDFDYAEPKEVTDFETILRDMSDSGEYAVIIGIAFDQLDAFTMVVPGSILISSTHSLMRRFLKKMWQAMQARSRRAHFLQVRLQLI